MKFTLKKDTIIQVSTVSWHGQINVNAKNLFVIWCVSRSW